MATRAEIAERHQHILAHLIAHPTETYVDVGRRFGLSDRPIRKVARAHGICLPRKSGKVPAAKVKNVPITNAERKAAPKCRICTILTERIEEGVACVRAKKGAVHVCQSCVERYHPRYILGWIREPIAHPVNGKEGK